jgi:hypothetical protein
MGLVPPTVVCVLRGVAAGRGPVAAAAADSAGDDVWRVRCMVG